MKLNKFFSALFGLLGTALAVGTVCVCLDARNQPVVLLKAPETVSGVAKDMMTAVSEGDYAAAGSLMYGEPDLGADWASDSAVNALVWDAFLESFSYQFEGDIGATDSGVVMDVTVTALDIPSVTVNLGERSRSLLAQRVEQAKDVSEIYDENNDYREDFVMEVLYDASCQALEEDARYVQRQVSINLVYQQDRWWVVPDQALLQAISGGIAG